MINACRNGMHLPEPRCRPPCVCVSAHVCVCVGSECVCMYASISTFLCTWHHTSFLFLFLHLFAYLCLCVHFLFFLFLFKTFCPCAYCTGWQLEMGGEERKKKRKKKITSGKRVHINHAPPKREKREGGRGRVGGLLGEGSRGEGDRWSRRRSEAPLALTQCWKHL